MENKPIRLGQQLAIWLGSFVIIGTLVKWYWGVPLNAILMAGGMTLLVTLVRSWMGRNRSGPSNS